MLKNGSDYYLYCLLSSILVIGYFHYKLLNTLHKMSALQHPLNHSIENISEKNDASQWDARLIQGKKQFESVYRRSEPYRQIKSRIPAGIEEAGVLLFEPLSDSLEAIRIVLKFSSGKGFYLFDFHGIKISG